MVDICANALLCGVERRKRSRTAFFYAKHLRRFKTLKASPSVQVTTRLTKTNLQCNCLNCKIIEKLNTYAHLQMFCCMVPQAYHPLFVWSNLLLKWPLRL